MKLSFVLFLSMATASYGQTAQQVENVITFSKIYGYVKYFHPSDEAALVDWNRLAIYGNKMVSGCKNANELQETLTRIFKPIAPTIQIFKDTENVSFNEAAVNVEDANRYKTIAWQHLGVGTATKESIYQSARTNRNIIAATNTNTRTFSPANSTMNATSLRGKQFTFKGKMRLADGDGQGQFWVRVDKANGKLGFFDNMSQRPVKIKEWGTYEIRGKVDSDATTIFFGVFLSGRGSIEFDDLTLEVKEGDTSKMIYTNSFNNDEDGKAPSNLPFNTSSTNYAITVKKQSAEEGFASISSIETAPLGKPHSLLFKEYPKVGEYMQKSIGNGLKIILPLALYGTEEQTFPAADKQLLANWKENLRLQTPTDMSGNNLYVRLGDLAIAWNIFQHFFPYFDVVKTDWQSALKKAVDKAYTDKTELDFQKTLQLLTAQLHDGHVRVNSSANQAYYLPPLHWEWIEGELVITDFGDSTPRLMTGDIVKKVNNIDAKEYFGGIFPFISAPTKGWLEYRAQTESLLGDKDSEMTLQVVHADNTTDKVVVTRNIMLRQYYASEQQDTVKKLSEEIMYVNIDIASMEFINKALPELEKSRVIICDLRGYPNKNHEFIKYLLKQRDTSMYWMQIPHIIYPDRNPIAGWSNLGWGLTPARTHFNAKIIFLIDGRAISYAESFMGFIENYKLATIVGQPTAGTNGNVNNIMLPGGYYISWTGMKVQKHNGTTHHGVGIIPDVFVNKTIKGVREGRDEFLERAIEIGKSF